MKKAFLVLALSVLAIAAAVAQPRAIGARLGYGVDFSYQHQLGANKVHLDVGVPFFNGVHGVCTYDWINPRGTNVPWSGSGQWNWYVGVGAGVGYHGFFNNANAAHTDYMSAGVAARLGIEYRHSFPMTIAIDWRPVFGIGTNFNNDVWWYREGLYHVGLSIYYNF